MVRFIFIFSLVINSYIVFSQKDAGAVKILDKFSANAFAAPSVSLNFTLETIDQVAGTDNKVTGTLILNKDKYKLDLKDNIVWFNGETSWSYLPAEKEVTISKPGKKNDAFQSRPSAVFSVYKKGYKIRLLEEKPEYYLIDLYPEDINSDHIRIRLTIGNPSLDLKGLEYKYKNGVTVILTVNEYDLKQNPDISTFTFFPENYKGVEIIDMR